MKAYFHKPVQIRGKKKGRISMTAREYLKQIEHLENEADHLRFELETAESTLNCISAIRYDKIRVQNGTQQHEAFFEKQVDRVAQLREAMLQKLAETNIKRHEIICVLNSLADVKYSRLLFMLYVEHKSIGECAKAMNYTYDYTIQLHNKALRAVKVPQVQ